MRSNQYQIAGKAVSREQAKIEIEIWNLCVTLNDMKAYSASSNTLINFYSLTKLTLLLLDFFLYALLT